MIHYKKLKKVILLLLAINILIPFNLTGQYSLKWARTYGGDGKDEAHKIIETKNGDLILAGYTFSNNKHLWIIKLDQNGNTIWGKTNKTKQESEAKSMMISKDSSIVVAGFSVQMYRYQSDLWILKLNQDGKELWSKTYGGNGEEAAYDIIETNDYGYAIAGFTSTNENFQDDALVLKLDSSGNKLWERTYGDEKKDYAYGISKTADNDLVICGTQGNRGGNFNSFWVVKVDSLGVDIWDKVYDFNKRDYATDITIGLDNYIYVAGHTRTLSVIDYDIILMKLDQDGTVIWKKTHSWGKWDQVTSITSTYDNGVVVAGFTRSGEVLSSNFVVTKFDENGNILWENIFARRSLDYANDVKETRDNGLAICGTTYMQGRGWDFALLKFFNNDQPVIAFAQDSVSTTTKQRFTLDACVKIKSNLKNVQILFNDSVVVNNANRNTVSESDDCNIPLKKTLKLEQGLNRVEIVLTDYKNHHVRKKCKIYFIPPSEIIW